MGEGNRQPMRDVHAFLCERHDRAVEELATIEGGFWSSAYSYVVGRNSFVLRLADSDTGFLIDQSAYRFRSPGLPVPEVVDIGSAFGGAYALSRRAYGRFVEDVRVDEADRVGPILDALFGALRAAGALYEADSDGRVEWHSHGRNVGGWIEWLRQMLVDDPSNTTSGWRTMLREDSELDELFRRSVDRIDELLREVPERRDLVHGDLLHQNVLIDDSATEITAVFSWKCSVLGDFLYDVAWCSFWEPWHPGIAAVDMWRRTFRSGIEPAMLERAESRHHCYELHIGVQHLAWCAWTGDKSELQGVAERLSHVLSRGPREQP